jgi:uncharacterized protein YxeA
MKWILIAVIAVVVFILPSAIVAYLVRKHDGG